MKYTFCLNEVHLLSKILSAPNALVGGSSPCGGTKFPNDNNGLACCRRFHFVSRKVINSYKQIFGGGVWGSRWEPQ